MCPRAPVDADLLLGCGDVRKILFTVHSEQGLREFVARNLENPHACADVLNSEALRKLDITCCDVDEAIIGAPLRSPAKSSLGNPLTIYSPQCVAFDARDRKADYPGFAFLLGHLIPSVPR